MSRLLITGSSDGLGLMAAKRLIASGHQVILHARNQGRARDAQTAATKAYGMMVGDLASIAETRGLADQANRLGPFDAVIHNAGVGDGERRVESVDGLEHIFAINVLAPYLLTALIEQPKRLIYLSSGMHRGGDPDLTDLQWKRRRWNGSQAYSDSKLFDAALALALARRWPAVRRLRRAHRHADAASRCSVRSASAKGSPLDDLARPAVNLRHEVQSTRKMRPGRRQPYQPLTKQGSVADSRPRPEQHPGIFD